MKYKYALTVALSVMYYHAIPQPRDVYAAASHRNLSAESPTLRERSQQIERSFKVSIAYRDEWVDTRVSLSSDNTFRSAEEALDMLLKPTPLYYEKAGDRFYVLHKKKKAKPSSHAGGTSVSTMPLLAN